MCLSNALLRLGALGSIQTPIQYRDADSLQDAQTQACNDKALAGEP